MRAAVEMTDDHTLHHDTDEHDENGSGDHRSNERPCVAVGEPTGVAAEHEHRAVREVQYSERAVNDGQAGGDQREQRAKHEAVETLRYEIGPVDHGCWRA